MALIKCPDCGKEYSDRADACPNCACPNDYKIELETQELQHEVNNVVKSSTGVEVFVRILVLVISIIIFIGSRDFFLSEYWIADFSENLVLYCMILFFTINAIEGFRLEGIKGFISGAIGGILLIIIVTLVLLWGFKSNEFVQTNQNWIVSAIFGGYGLLYFILVIPKFFKYNIRKEDVNINDFI